MAGERDLQILGPGDVFDRRYRIVRELGRGGFSVVYLAEHLEIGHRVAVKLLRADRSDARFVREAQVLSQLRSAHTVRMLDFGRTSTGQPFIVCDYVEGTPLDERGRGPMHADRVLKIVAQALEALAEAHELGIVHRDLKPSNLFLTTQGDVRVLDFGIAKLLPEAHRGSVTLTNPGIAIGTVAYMAPEQLAGAPIVPATDVFSLGLVAWELLFGERANDSRDALRAAARQFGRRYDFGGAPLGGDLVDLLNTFVAQNVELRPKNGGEALAQLRERWRQGDQRAPLRTPTPPSTRDPVLTSTTVVDAPQAGEPVFCAWDSGFCWAIGHRVNWAADQQAPVEIRLPPNTQVSALAAWGVGFGYVGTIDGHVIQVGGGDLQRYDVGSRVTALSAAKPSVLAATEAGEVFRIAPGKAPQRVTTVSEPVTTIASSRQQETIAIGAGRTVFLRESRSGTLRSVRQIDEEVVSIIFSPDDYLVAILTVSQIVVASALTLDSMVRFRNNRGRIVAIRFTADGQLQTAVLQGDQLQIAAVD